MAIVLAIVLAAGAVAPRAQEPLWDTGTFSILGFDPETGEVVLASGGHPAPLLRTANGKTEAVSVKSAMMLGYDTFTQTPHETRVTLGKGDLLAIYTDGLTEAFTPGREDMFGTERLRDVFAGRTGNLPLPQCAEAVCKAVTDFTRQSEQQDDQTLLLLRRS